TETIANSVDRLKQVIRNFLEKREGLVPGGCPLLNTAVESDDGNLALRNKAKRAMAGLLARLESIVEDGKKGREIEDHVDSEEVATLIVSTLEGSLMVNRLRAKDSAVRLAVKHLEEFLEKEIRSDELATKT